MTFQVENPDPSNVSSKITAIKKILICLIFLSMMGAGFAQNKKFVKNGSLYFSWGYNTEWYSHSDLHIDQAELNNDYVFQNLSAHDHIGWDKLFQRALSIPQYNYRLGYFFNEKQDWAIELNFDHTKYIVEQEQSAHIKGTINNKSLDSTIDINSNTLKYQLNNGANFFLFNIVKKFDIYNAPNAKYLQLCGLVKAGVGPVVPHVENTIFGNDNKAHFQLGGWNTGIEAGIKATFANHIYLEFTNKIDYARYSKLRIYKGLADQSFFTYELILNLGYTFKLGK